MLTLAFLGIFAAMLVAAGAFHLGRTSAALRGRRLVTCPETGDPAAVALDVGYSAARSAFGRPHFRLSDCSRWPGRARCGQMCLGDLEAAPEDTQVSTILRRFYAGKRCALCGWAFGEIREDTMPALLGPDGVTREWTAFAAEMIPSVLRSHAPVCWRCHVGHSFRRSHPEIFRRPDGRMPPVM